MSGLTSMLVPLQHTFEGWPDAPIPSVTEQLMLYMGAPALITVAIVVYVLLTRKREARLAAESGVVEPLWLGGGKTDGRMLESGVEAATSNKTAEPREGQGPPPRTGAEGQGAGGASARW